MLGKMVKDTLTGLKGVAVAKIEYMNGCVQYQIQPKVIIDGKPVEALWYDMQRVELVAPPEPKPESKPEPKPECLPHPDTTRGSSGGPPPTSTPHFGK